MPLVIEGREIRKISGPVSMYILVPKDNSDFPNLPVYMLFGDVHNSDENMCPENPGVSGEYKIYDLEFLGMLNSLGAPEHPIDFYVEGGDFHNKSYDDPFSDNYPMQQLWNLYSECYTHNGRKIAQYAHNTECKNISNIRWQSGDPRFFDDYPKSYLLNCNMKRLLGLVNFSIDRDNRHLMLLQAAIDLFKENQGCSKKLLSRKSVGVKLSLEEELTGLKKIILDKNSFIFKQLKKIKPKRRVILIDWIKTYCDYSYADVVTTNEITTDLLAEFNQLHLNCIKYIEKYINGKYIDTEFFKEHLQDNNWKKLMFYYLYLCDKYRIVLDIYTLCRTFKYLDVKGSNPVMNIVYTGNSHTEGLIYFLETVSGLYTVKNIQDFSMDSVKYLKKPINRCVDIHLKLNLGELIDNLKSVRVYSEKVSVKGKGVSRSRSGKRPGRPRRSVGRPKGSRNKPRKSVNKPRKSVGRPKGSRNKPRKRVNKQRKSVGRPRRSVGRLKGSRNKPK